MALFKTRIEMIHQVIDNLGVLVPGQAPSNDVVSRVDLVLDAIMAQLAAEDYTYVADIGTSAPAAGGQFDLATFLPVADCIAWRVAGGFNLAGDPALKVLNDEAERRLRHIARPERTRRVLRTDIMLRAGNRRWSRFDFSTGR